MKKHNEFLAEDTFKCFKAAYDKSPRRPGAQNLPQWAEAYGREIQKEIVEVIAAYQAVVATKLACRNVYPDGHQLFEIDKDHALHERAIALAALIRLCRQFGQPAHDLAADAMKAMPTERDAPSMDCVNELAIEVRSFKGVMQITSEFVTQGFGRNGAICTPTDVAGLMTRLTRAKAHEIDVYCENGLGLYYGAAQETGEMPNLVGKALENNSEWSNWGLPRRLIDAYENVAIRFDRQAVLERMLIELELLTVDMSRQSRTLLINAAKSSLPFYLNEKNPDVVGDLNHLLSSKYSRIVALVPNAYLTGGRGAATSGEVLRYCVSKGLSKVIQLPEGVIGAAHLSYSVLLFTPQEKTKEIDFIQIDPMAETGEFKVYRPAQRRFGMALRKNAINLKAFTVEGDTPQAQRRLISVSELLANQEPSEGGKGRRRRLVSFEASYSLKSKVTIPFLQTYETRKLSEIVRIHRVQHMEIAAPGEGHRYVEVSASHIGALGELEPGDVKYTTDYSEGRLHDSKLEKGDLMLCIRGAVGKVAMMTAAPKEVTVPNQSFVTLSFRSPAAPGTLSPELLYWWLRSSECQKIIHSRIVAAGVPRLSIVDIEELPVPVGPSEHLEREKEKFDRWRHEVHQYLEHKKAAQRIAAEAFGGTK